MKGELAPWRPFRELERMRREMDRFRDGLFRHPEGRYLPVFFTLHLTTELTERRLRERIQERDLNCPCILSLNSRASEGVLLWAMVRCWQIYKE